MKKFVMLVGPPGSGKSTLSKKYQSEGFIYINQDLQGKEHMLAFDLAVLAGENVVLDRMNFSKQQRDRYLWLAKKEGYDTEIIVLHQPYVVCFQRCMDRKGHLTIKDEQAARGALNTFFTKYERVTDDEANKVTRIWPEGNKPLAVVCDLDGTLCNVEHRRHFVRRPEGERKDWQGFFKEMVNDTPNTWCVELLRLMSTKYTIVYCSGRPDNWRKETVEWLKKNDLFSFENGGPNYDFHLYMRPRSDSRQDNIVKETILDFEILSRFTPYFMVDDRQQVVDMYRSRDFTVLQCEKGDF